ncbi:MAG: hypothetical protein ACI80I_002814 [Akkermansiaceae bacterium]|jgi:hypothetical protein
MRNIFTAVLLASLVGAAKPPALADGFAPEPTLFEDFTMQPETRWRFFTDQVMGGESTGGVTFAQEDGLNFARMTGRVSTANRGGFIQIRLDLVSPPPEGTTGVRLIVRGNGQRYFVHLRTGGTLLPWQYYQAGFEVSESWSEVRLPMEAFTASGAFLRTAPKPGSLASIAVVAYGRDHDARIDVREVGFY